MTPREVFSGAKLALLDQDGTLFLGGKALPGARDFVSALRERGISPVFLSNNTSRSLRRTLERLNALGFDAAPDEVRDAGWATRAFLVRERIRRIALFANEEVTADFEEAGFELDWENPEAVVLAYDTSFTFGKLVLAQSLLMRGVRFIATHPDRLCPTENGFVPDIASLIAALRSAGTPEPLVIGKPSPTMVLPILQERGVLPDECVMVGDRLYTDIRMTGPRSPTAPGSPTPWPRTSSACSRLPYPASPSRRQNRSSAPSRCQRRNSLGLKGFFFPRQTRSEACIRKSRSRARVTAT